MWRRRVISVQPMSRVRWEEQQQHGHPVQGSFGKSITTSATTMMRSRLGNIIGSMKLTMTSYGCWNRLR